MGPKQTTPQGDNPAGKKEGQDGATPVFSFTGTSATSGSPLGGPSATSPNEPGTLGADTLSTGANVSRTMDSLNRQNQPTHGGLVFAKHRFDKIDPKTGDILLTPDEEPKKKGFFATLFGGGRRKQTPESVSMVENRHKDVVIPEQYQNPGRKKRRQEPAQPAQTQAVAQPTPTTAQSASVQPAPTPTPVPPVVPPTQTAAPISSQPALAPAMSRKSRKIQTIALIGAMAVIAILVVGVLITNTMNNNRKNYYQSTSNSSNTSNDSNTTTTDITETITNKNVLAKLSEQKNDIDWLENIINALYSGEMRYIEYAKVNNDVQESVSNLEQLQKTLTDDDITPEKSTFASILAKRIQGYKDLARVFGSFVGYQEKDSEQSSIFNTYLAETTSVINPYAVQFKQAIDDAPSASSPVQFWTNNEIFMSDLAKAVAEPIDYEKDGYVSEMIAILLKNGGYNA